MNLFSQNLTKIQHIRQMNQADKIQQNVKQDFLILKKLVDKPQSDRYDKQLHSKQTQAQFRDQEFNMEDYVESYFDNQEQNNQKRRIKRAQSVKTFNGFPGQNTQNLTDYKLSTYRIQNMQKLRSISQNQERERMQLGEVFRLQEKIDNIIHENEKKKTEQLNRAINESDFYGLKKLNFSNYKFIKLKNPNPQNSDYLEKSTLMIDEMSSSYKYVYKLSKKYCIIDKDMTEKVIEKVKDIQQSKFQQSIKNQKLNQEFSQRIVGNPFSKQIRNDSLLSKLINSNPIDPTHKKLMIQKKLNNFYKRIKQKQEATIKHKLIKANSELILPQYSFTRYNDTSMSIMHDSPQQLKFEKNIDQILTDDNYDQLMQVKKRRPSKKKRSISTQSLNQIQDYPTNYDNLQKNNSTKRQMLSSNKYLNRLQQSYSNDQENSFGVLNEQNITYDLNNSNTNKQEISHKNINVLQTNKQKSSYQSFLQTVKNIDLSQSLQYNALKQKNNIYSEPFESKQKLSSKTLKDSPFNNYNLFQNKDFRQKTVSVNLSVKPKYLRQINNRYLNENQYQQLQIQPYQRTQSLKQSNDSQLLHQESPDNSQNKVIQRKIIDNETLLKIRNDSDFKEFIIKLIVRENFDIKAVFDTDYSDSISKEQESLKFFTKFLMKNQPSITSTQLYENLSQIFNYEQQNTQNIQIQTKEEQKDEITQNQDKEDIPLNIVQSYLFKFPNCLNENLLESQLFEYLQQNMDYLKQIKNKLYL